MVNIFTFIFGFYILWRIYIIFRSGKNGGLELFLGTLILLLSVIIEIIFIQRGNQIINTAIAGELIFVIILIFEVNKNFSMNVSTERDSILRLQDISNKDGLTGLFNHRFICQKLTDIYNENSEIPYSVAMFDLDNFKSVNDTYGHKIGDLILQETARIMTENTRGSDTVGRYGGEEFLIIFYNTKIEDAYLVCDRIREKIEKEIVENTGIKITISGGLTGFSKEVEDIIKIADELMYKAKKLGKNRIEKFED
ncbi:MAG: GGDEF domain-containing protein [Eubacteriales bacterium]|nr:GGDEF domain-containing protein [Eubacteriales bacterium]